MTDQLDPWNAGFVESKKGDREPEPPCGRCEWCQVAQPAFDNLLDIADGLWRRFQSPGQNSFTANGRNLHRTVCTYIRRAMPTEHARPEGPAYDLALQKWAHEHHDYNSACAARRYSDHLLLDIMTSAEVQEWAASRVRPRGAPDYRLCKVCRPELPTA
ncbi:hypothetical protein [Streptomyces clavuligerus]|uniref:Uncharacterized protein n=1 Tax=Streptomyces clavuligerus TaxID=1901 RepID=Q6TMT6_STRCL|nr:hypothetical protein [Streptomyces clavuligerus]AAQ93537.1 hypothetical protein pSCL2.4.H9.6 [Streptomyces clavuligerus]AXU16833.1 hypothetical protein D1794_29145 [Streptomyces clavuligerus]EDY48752.1 conserved hypothetical protein [Streptomyces clavuligerus]MBY6300968.1 hypothetical protein [Streptomyces clavuligerus]QPJ97020.1 hypothetical protein GE265_28310 [Streptomyces clavuligerus]